MRRKCVPRVCRPFTKMHLSRSKTASFAPPPVEANTRRRGLGRDLNPLASSRRNGKNERRITIVPLNLHGRDSLLTIPFPVLLKPTTSVGKHTEINTTLSSNVKIARFGRVAERHFFLHAEAEVPAELAPEGRVGTPPRPEPKPQAAREAATGSS